MLVTPKDCKMWPFCWTVVCCVLCLPVSMSVPARLRKDLTSQEPRLRDDRGSQSARMMRTSESEDSIITFPDDDKVDSVPIESRLLKPRMDECRPVCTNGKDFCEEDPSYPSEYLSHILKKVISPQKFQEVYGDDNLTIARPDIVAERTDYVNEVPLCGAMEHTIYPKVAQNKEDNWLYVVNQGDYVQGIRIEKCLNDGSPCSFNDRAPAGIETVCRQKFIYRKLLALGDDGAAMTDSFRLPSCCACFSKSKTLTMRIGGDERRKLCPIPGKR